MLDQNTDRMWYVIGAVIVGAAIIFLVNSSFPQLFASVGNTFKDKTEDVSKVVDSISPVEKGLTDGINLIPNGNREIVGQESWNTTKAGNGEPFDKQWRPEFIRHVDLAPTFEKYGLEQTYTLSFDIKSLDPSVQNSIYVYMQTNEGSKYDFVNKGVSNITSDYQRVTYTGLKAGINAENLTKPKPYDTAHLAFYGTYGTGNKPAVKNVRLEREYPLIK